MNMKYIITAKQCENSEHQCESCGSPIDLSDKLIKVKQQQPALLVWCEVCADIKKNSGDCVVDLPVAPKDLAMFSANDSYEDFKEKLTELDKKYFDQMRWKHERNMLQIRLDLPYLIQGVAEKLDLDDPVDLINGILLRALVQEILIKQRELLEHEFGPNAIFHGYTPEEAIALVGFIQAVNYKVATRGKD